MTTTRQTTAEAPETLPRRLAAAVLTAFQPRMAAAAAAGGIVVFVVLGILQRTRYPTWTPANLDSETSIATLFAATLFWMAAVAWLLVALLTTDRRRPTWIWAAMLTLLAVDEGNGLHERLEQATGIDWQALYIPVLAIAAAAGWALLRDRRLELPQQLLIAAAVAWSGALILELVQNWGGAPVAAHIYDPTMIAEEALEMVGCTLTLLAALTWQRTDSFSGATTPS